MYNKNLFIPIILIIIVAIVGFGFSINVFGEKESPQILQEKKSEEIQKEVQQQEVQEELTQPIIFNTSVYPTKVEPGDIMFIRAEIKDDYGIESVKADMGGIEIIELRIANQESGELAEAPKQGIWEAEWLVRDTEIKDYITTITAINIKGLSSSVKIKWTDPTWVTPTAVSSFTSENAQGPATDSIDGNTGSDWDEDPKATDQNEGSYEWYITYNMGATYEISKIQIYTDPDDTDSPCKVAIIKVCDDAACDTELNLLGGDCAFTGTVSAWHECSFTGTEGQYIYVEGGKETSDVCEDKETGDDMADFMEFQAYCASLPGGFQPRPPAISPSGGGFMVF